jgi:hypothetical protein
MGATLSQPGGVGQMGQGLVRRTDTEVKMLRRVGLAGIESDAAP